MSDEAGEIWVVLNGEIYNFPELREELRSRGYVFRTRSDTEVVVHGYREWGCDVLQRLNGMFALAVWDERSRRLILARDRLGIKLCYYTLDSGRLVFASEIRALLRVGAAGRQIDPVALDLFLRYRYTPAPLSILKGVRKLPAGSVLIAGEGRAGVRRWWNFRPEPLSPMPRPNEAAEELTGLYRRAVSRHLRSDVPVGLFLSGGVDSGLLLALMSELGQVRPTFSIGFGDDFADDELRKAERTARLFGADHTAVSLTRKEFRDSLPDVVRAMEEPVSSASIVPMYHLSRRVRRDVKVALIGQGPDELFGGYTRHLGIRYGAYWRGLPGWIRKAGGTMASMLPRAEPVRRGLYSLGETDRIERYRKVFSLLPGPRVDGLFREGMLPPAAGDAVLDCWAELFPLMDRVDELGGFQVLELRSSLPDELLMYADKLSMAHGLEVRVPYLDREIVEYVERLPQSYKVRGFSRKWIHKRVCREYLPNEILHRKKRGFAVNVVDDWFRERVSGVIDDCLGQRTAGIYQILDYGGVQSLVSEHRSGRRNHYKILSSLVFLTLWLEQLETPGTVDGVNPDRPVHASPANGKADGKSWR